MRINKTVLSDSDGFGGHFFFQSSVVHNLDDEKVKDVAEAEEVAEEGVEKNVENISEEDAEEDVKEEIAEESAEEEEEMFLPNEVETKLLEVDPTFNEIDDKEGETANVFNIDDGLQE